MQFRDNQVRSCELIILLLLYNMLQEEYFLISADNLTLFAVCLVQAALFNLKYLFIFGVPTMFAELDGLNMPTHPCFLLTEYKASSIWRRFDVGLYNFISKSVSTLFLAICHTRPKNTLCTSYQYITRVLTVHHTRPNNTSHAS